METLYKENGMSDLSVADAMALNKDQGFGEQVWPLVWLAALGGGDGILGGGRNDAAAGATVASLDSLQNQVSSLLDTINANTGVLQHEAIQTQLYNMSNLIQSGDANITQKIGECCCKMQADICDVGYKISDSNKDILNAICQQTSHFDQGLTGQTMQNIANTQRIIDGQARILDGQRDGTATILAKLNEQENNELREKNSELQSKLDKQELITELGGQCCPPQQCCGGS